MRLSSKKHGYFKAFYYPNPVTFHRYALSGRTAADRLNWMFKHISARTDINKGDLKLVADDEGGVRMINLKTGGRMYAMRAPVKGRYVWLEEPPLFAIETMHEDYTYNQ